MIRFKISGINKIKHGEKLRTRTLLWQSKVFHNIQDATSKIDTSK